MYLFQSNIQQYINGLGLVDLQRMVVPWLLQEHPKKNCFYIYGPSNTCKTKFARSLADGVYNLGMYLTSNEFYFQECMDTSLILWEETKITDACTFTVQAIPAKPSLHDP